MLILREWAKIELTKRDYYWKCLSKNPNAIYLLEQNPEKINWENLSLNPNAIYLLEKNPEKIDWENLCLNPNAIPLLEKNINKLNHRCWYYLSRNPNILPIVQQYSEKIKWDIVMSDNPNANILIKYHPTPFDAWELTLTPSTLERLENNYFEHIPWHTLASKINALPLLCKYLHKFNNDLNFWYNLSTNPGAFKILNNNVDKINWTGLCLNTHPKVIHLLEKNQEKIDWENFFQNPNIFIYDYDAMRKHCLIFKEELIKNRFHPRNICKFYDWKIDGFESDYQEND